MFLFDEGFADWFWKLTRLYETEPTAFTQALVARMKGLGPSSLLRYQLARDCNLCSIHAAKGLLVSRCLRTNPSYYDMFCWPPVRDSATEISLAP